jgi:hypothetical protein
LSSIIIGGIFLPFSSGFSCYGHGIIEYLYDILIEYFLFLKQFRHALEEANLHWGAPLLNWTVGGGQLSADLYLSADLFVFISLFIILGHDMILQNVQYLGTECYF